MRADSLPSAWILSLSLYNLIAVEHMIVISPMVCDLDEWSPNSPIHVTAAVFLSRSAAFGELVGAGSSHCLLTRPFATLSPPWSSRTRVEYVSAFPSKTSAQPVHRPSVAARNAAQFSK